MRPPFWPPDVEGVETAEAAARALLGHRRIEWRLFPEGVSGDADHLDACLAEPGRETREASDLSPVVMERARLREHQVHEHARSRFPDRPALARSVGRAALVDCVLHAAGWSTNPVTALRALWKTGYVVAAVEPGCITLELPRPPTAS